MALEQLARTVDFVQDATPSASDANDGETYLDTSLSPPRVKVFDANAGTFVEPAATGLQFVGRFQLSIDSFIQSFNVSGQEGKPQDVAFSADGASMFVIGSFSDKVHQYSLSTAFDLTTASFSGTSFDVSGQDISPQGVAFSADGTSMFVPGANNSSIFEYALSTAFDLTTASFSGTSFDVSGQTVNPQGVAFSTDGTSMFLIENVNIKIHQYSLSTAFDLTTASFSGSSFDVSGQEGDPQGVAFSTDGTSMFVTGESSDAAHQYSLSTAFDLTTASFSGTSFDISGQASDATNITFSADGASMFVTERNTKSVLRYLIGEVAPRR